MKGYLAVFDNDVLFLQTESKAKALARIYEYFTGDDGEISCAIRSVGDEKALKIFEKLESCVQIIFLGIVEDWDVLEAEWLKCE